MNQDDCNNLSFIKKKLLELLQKGVAFPIKNITEYTSPLLPKNTYRIIFENCGNINIDSNLNLG